MALAPPPPPPLSAGHCGILRRELGPDADTGGPVTRGRPAGAATPQLGGGSPPPRADAGSPRHRARRLGSPAQDLVGPASTTLAPRRAGSGEPWLTGRRRVQSARPSVHPAPRASAASPAPGETTLFGQWQRSDFLRGQSLRGNSRTAVAGLGTGGGGDGVLPRIVSRSSACPGAATHRPRDVSTTQQVARKLGARPPHRTSPKPSAHANLFLRQTTVNLLLDGTATASARFVENTVPAVETIHDHRLLNGANAGSVGMPVGPAAHGGVTDTSSGPELPVMQLTAAVQRLAVGAARSVSEPTVNPPSGPIASLRESPSSIRPTTLTRKPNPSSCKAKSDRTTNPEAKPSVSRTRGGPGSAPARRVGARLTGKGSGMSAAHSGQGQSGRELGQRGWMAGGPPSDLGSGDCGQDGEEEEEEEDGSEAVEDDGSEDSSAQSVDLDGDDDDDDEEELPDGPDEVGDEVDVSDGTSSDDDGGDYAAALDLAVSTAACSVPGSAQDGQLKPALVPSIFDNVPPTVYFGTAEETIAMLPWPLRRKLKWKMSTVTPQVVRKALARSHFRPTAKRHDWLGCWGRHMKSPGFRALREHQKLNHFPGSFQIGRKDRLWRNLSQLRARFGRRSFGFVPRSFVLPQDTRALRLAWPGGGGGGATSHMRWIVKPPASARGMGIKVVSKWSQLPKKRPLLVQRYLHKPYLIEGSKFDLRIYVYVSSYNPLRVYVFKDGLVRFASCKYSSATKTLGNRFMHLTNYSVNKNNAAYKSNDDRTQCEGHKWALKALWGYLCDKGVDCRTIWEQIKDIAVKTIIASEPFVSSLLAQFVGNRRSCHELFGFDVMLDEKLKPWLLEVNISPSLHSNSPLDVAVKGQMIKDLLNMAGFQIPASLQGGGDGARTGSDVTTNERSKHAFYLSPRNLDERGTLLDTLTPGDVRMLVEAEDELRRCGRFERAFPSPSARYLVFFAQQRYHDLLLHRWALAHPPGTTAGIDLLKRLCKKGVHLGPTEDPAHIWTPSARSEPRPRAVVTCEAACARAAKPPAKQPEEREKVPTPGPQVCGISSSLGFLALSQSQGVHRALRTAASVGDVA